MKHLYIPAFFVAINCLLLSFSIAHAQTTKETRTLAPFDAIKLDIDATVYLLQDTTQQVIVEAPANALAHYVTKVRRNTLKITDTSESKGNQSVIIYVTAPRIKKITLLGSGTLIGKNTLTGADLDVNVTGSGNLSLQAEILSATFSLTGSGSLTADVRASAVKTSAVGSGDVTLTGTVGVLTLKLSGSGDIQAVDCHSQQAVVKISGSGDVRLHVVQGLRVKIYGSGDVYYTGGVKEIETKTIGSGRVRTL